MGINEIVEDAKKAKGPLAKIMQERTTQAQQEYEEVKIRRLVEEERARINELKRQGGPMEPTLATGFTSRIMQLAQVDPEKAKAFLDGLDEENMNKLAFLMAAESDRTGAILKLAQSPGTSVKDLVEIVKLMRPENGGVDLKGISSIFEAGVNAAKASQPQGPKNTEEGFKYIYETFVKPFQETLAKKENTIVEERLKRMEEKIVNPIDWLRQQKQTATELGLTSAGSRSEMDLKLEEMKQSHDIDMARLSWEQQKYMLTAEADRDKWGAIQQTFSPIFAMAAPEIRGAIRKAGQELGKTIGTNPGSPSPNQPQLAGFVCPSCQTELTVPIPPNAPEEVPVKCPKCGTITPAKLKQTGEKSLPPAPPEEKPASTRLRAAYT